MENASPADPVETPDPVLADAKPKNEWVDLGSFLLKLVLIVFVLVILAIAGLAVFAAVSSSKGR